MSKDHSVQIEEHIGEPIAEPPKVKRSFFQKFLPEIATGLIAVFIIGIGAIAGDYLKPSNRQIQTKSGASLGLRCNSEKSDAACEEQKDGESCKGMPGVCKITDATTRTCGCQPNLPTVTPKEGSEDGQDACEAISNSSVNKAEYQCTVCGGGIFQNACGVCTNGPTWNVAGPNQSGWQVPWSSMPSYRLCKCSNGPAEGPQDNVYVAAAGNCEAACKCIGYKCKNCHDNPSPPPPTLTPTITPTPVPVSCNRKLDFSISIDRSYSMNNNFFKGKSRLEWAKKATVEFIKELKKTDTNKLYRISINSFGAQGNDNQGKLGVQPNSVFNSTLNFQLSDDFEAAIAAVNKIEYIKPGKCLSCGINIGNQQLSSSSAETTKVEIIVSNGMTNKTWMGTGNTASDSARRESLRFAEQGRRFGIFYKIIGFGERTAKTINETLIKRIVCQDPSDQNCIKSNYTYTPNPTLWGEAMIKLLPSICAGPVFPSIAPPSLTPTLRPTRTPAPTKSATPTLIPSATSTPTLMPTLTLEPTVVPV